MLGGELHRDEAPQREPDEDNLSVLGDEGAHLFARGIDVRVEGEVLEIDDLRAVAGQERRAHREAGGGERDGEGANLGHRSGESVEGEDRGPASVGGEGAGIAPSEHSFRLQRAASCVDHASPRLIEYARIFLWRLVRSTPRITAVREIFQPVILRVSTMYLRSD